MDQFGKWQAVNRNREIESQKAYEENSLERLTKNIRRKFDTANIGSLASIEEHLGYLWGHNKSPDERTENEKRWLAKWQELRKEILDKGNHQMRGAMEELNQYSVKWNRFQKKWGNDER